jgi:hypothetical protein
MTTKSNNGGSKSAPTVATISTRVPVVGPGSTGSTGGTAIPGLVNTGLSSSGKVQSPYSNGFQSKLVKCLDGVEQFLPAGSSLTLNGQSMSQEALASALQAVVSLFTALSNAQKQSKAIVSQARLALAAQLPVAHQLYTSLDHALIAFFGKGNPVLANFGIASGARKNPPNSATKAAAAATAKLTRQARHTMGKKQRLQVTGGKATIVAVNPNGGVVPGGTPGASLPAEPATPTAANGTGNGGGSTPSAS